MKRQVWFIILMGLVLVGGYQNCSNSMSFDGETLSSKSAKEGVVEGDSDPVAGDPNTAMPPDNDDDTDIDYDHNNRKIAFSCSTGVRLGWDKAALAAASDLDLKNQFGLLFHYKRPLRNVTVESIRGSVMIKNSHTILNYDSVKGVVSYSRALNVEKVSNVEAGISSTASVNLKELSNVRAAYTCASGHTIDRISNLNGAFIKIRGRPSLDSSGQMQPNGKANEISNIKAAFASLFRVNTALINNVEGELIIRNSHIERIENVKGGLTLINSTVGLLKNAEGVVRIKNSAIATEENVTANVISWR